MTPRGLARKIARLEGDEGPVYRSFRRARFGPKEQWEEGAARKVWYSSEHEHWRGWLSQYDSPGGYGRKVTTGRSAEFAYNHIVNPFMLIWLGEAVGIPTVVMRAAKQGALKEETMAGMSRAIREIVPFVMMEAFLLRRTRQRPK
jgi:hypothetical protein